VLGMTRRGHPATDFQKAFAQAGHGGPGVTAPSRLVVLVYLGAACLAAGVAALGAGLLTS